jgi:hypothetical protein
VISNDKGEYFGFRPQEHEDDEQRPAAEDNQREIIKFGEPYENTKKHSKFDLVSRRRPGSCIS